MNPWEASKHARTHARTHINKIKQIFTENPTFPTSELLEVLIRMHCSNYTFMSTQCGILLHVQSVYGTNNHGQSNGLVVE